MTMKHTHQMVFGRRVAGCPRCDELTNGAEPVKGWGSLRKEMDAERSASIHAHFSSTKHVNGGCGPVCTFGEW